jgi:hypothetical protein
MKTIIRNVIQCILLISFIAASPQKSAAQAAFSFQVFYDDLSPYGSWVNNPQYGYVWIPNAGPGFVPYYSDGYWVYTDYGWTWVSDYPWGWAPFHYGRWFSDPFYGPMWVPGYEWSPGWVTWRRCEGYYGWAPIEPGISVSVAYSNGYRVPNDRWIFARDHDFGQRHASYIRGNENPTLINNSVVINNIRTEKSSNVRYNAGPDRSEVQKRSGREIPSVSLQQRNTPGQSLNNNQLQMYKPRIEKNANAERKIAPAKVIDIKDVKRQSERKVNSQPQNKNQATNKAQPQNRMQQQDKSQPALNHSSNQNSGMKQKQPKQAVPAAKTPEQMPSRSPSSIRNESRPLPVNPPHEMAMPKQQNPPVKMQRENAPVPAQQRREERIRQPEERPQPIQQREPQMQRQPERERPQQGPRR